MFCLSTGDAAVALLKAGADATKRDGDGSLAIDLAPDNEVRDHQPDELQKTSFDQQLGPKVY
jgi:hypothetical protein